MLSVKSPTDVRIAFKVSNLFNCFFIAGSDLKAFARLDDDKIAGACSVWHCAPILFAIWIAQSSALSNLSDSIEPITWHTSVEGISLFGNCSPISLIVSPHATPNKSPGLIMS